MANALDTKRSLDLMDAEFRLARDDYDRELGMGKLARGGLALEQDSYATLLQKLQGGDETPQHM